MSSITKTKKEISKQNKTKICQSLIDRTIENLAEQLEKGYSDGMKQYIKAMSLFHRYSINNLFLIMAQMPEATYVAGFQTWKKLKRKVLKGEKGIRILAPIFFKNNDTLSDKYQINENNQDRDPITFFRTVYVFDISQTSGAKLPELTRSHGNAEKLIPKIENVLKNTGIDLTYEDIDLAYGKSYNCKIVIKSGMNSADTFSTLIHEYAHEILHQSNNRKESKTICELEADAVACVVSERFGIQALQASADYIKLWDGNKSKLLERMEQIRICSQEIIRKIEDEIDKKN